MNITITINHQPPDRELELICAEKKCGRTGRRTDFVNCTLCQKNYHANCLDIPLMHKFVSSLLIIY